MKTMFSPIIPIAALTLTACAQESAQDSVIEAKDKEVQPMFRSINEKISVSPQISLEDIKAAQADGVTLIVNNRPDGEEPSAPQSADIEAAAKAAGMDYISIPITHSGFSAPQVEAMINALDSSKGKILAYCRSGTRSTLLWSLAQAKKGMAPDEIARLAGNAGYDITPVRAMVEALAGPQ
ncbi:MAG: TIGR01244 family sulfur transferase [Parasphingorhabdus sp.]|uniref:TIGR01244 family sulfur transferase n=1 Tax=Parasphingorhabdus sp. TaxID=2709688 RepID=UPI0030033D6C